MGNILLLLAGFALLTGLAMLIYKFTSFSSVESILLSVAAIIFVQFLTGLFGNVFIGTIVLYAGGFAGMVLFFAVKGRAVKGFFSPGFVAIAIVFLLSTLAFRNILFFTWDEFTQWGKAVKFIMNSSQLPAGAIFSGDSNPPGTSLFHVFFLKLTGFVEGNAFVSNFLLVWSGFALPICSLEWKEWKKVVIYCATMFLALYSLYQFPYMTAYVDMPVAAWAGGLAAWWYVRQGKKSLLVLPVAGLFVLSMFKKSVGPLFAVYVMVFMIVITASKLNLKDKAGRKAFFSKFKKQKVIILFIFPAVVVLGIVLWVFVVTKNAGDGNSVLPGINNIWDTLVQMVTLSTEKARITIKSGMYALFNSSFSSVSALKITILPCIAGIVIVASIIKHFISDIKEKRKYASCIIAFIIGAVLYFAILMYIYINTFSEQESMRAASMQRYFSIYIVFGMLLLLTPLYKPRLRENTAGAPDAAVRPKAIISMAVLLFFFLGLNNNFLTYATSLRKSSLPHYTMRVSINNAAEHIRDIVRDGETIYMIAQGSTGIEIVAAGYEIGPVLNRYNDTCFNFTEGNKPNKYLLAQFPLEHLPGYLINNGYDYLWVYRNDAYFQQKAGALFNTPNIQEGDFYKINVVNGAVQLKLIGNFR